MIGPLSTFGRIYDPINARQDAATIPVSSRDGFARVMTLLARQGRRQAHVLITKPFAVTSPIFIPRLPFAPRISCAPGAVVRPIGAVECAFKCEGGAVFDRVDVGANSISNTADYFRAFVSCRTTPAGPPVVALRQCGVIADRLLTGDDVVGDDTSDYALCEFMEQCIHVRPSGLAGSLGPIIAKVQRMVSNSVDTGAGEAIFLEGNAAIIANTFSANGVNTSNGTGGNILAANQGSVGGYFAKTLHATDTDLDARTPAAHASSHEPGGADEMAVDAVAATGSLRTLGTSATSACAGNDARLSDARTPTAHKTSHENGGADELSVAGLSGLLADGQTPLAHKASHENGGADEMSVAGLSGLLADAQTPTSHASSHQNGGGDEISVAGLSGKLADGQDALALLSATTTIDVVSAAAPTAGQVLTATSDSAATWQTPSSGSAWTTVMKTATQTRTSTTTYTDDDTLKFSMLANTTYAVRIKVIATGNASADLKSKINGPASPTAVRGLKRRTVGTAEALEMCGDYSDTETTEAMVPTSPPVMIEFDFVIENGANTGVLAFQWAQAVSNIGATNIHKGSYLEYAEVA